MEASIRVEPGRSAEAYAGKALDAFRKETHPLGAHVEGVSVHLVEEASDPGKNRKAVRVRIDFRRGGRYLAEAEGEDWAGTIESAARKATQGAARELRRRWELDEP